MPKKKKKKKISGAVKYVLANSYLCCVLSKLLPSRKVIGAKQVQLEISRA